MAEIINFTRGAPSPDLIPVEAVRKATTRVLEDDWKTALSYGVGIGHPALCEWIADRHGIAAEQVMATNGSLEAGAMVFRHLLGPGDRVIVEQPSYDRTLLLLKQLGVEFVPVALESDGIDLDAVEAALAEGPIKLAHIIPNFHNPAGCTLSLEKRERLIALSEEHGFWIFEDDPYRELPFGEEPPPTMLSMDRSDRVIHASSFSKTISPGVRVGYLAGPTGPIAELAEVANETYISPNMLAGAIAAELGRSGALDENIAFVKVELRKRRDALVAGLNEHLPESRFVIPGGGYFLWADLAEGTDAVALAARAKEAGAPFLAGPAFMLDGGGSSVRFSFASVPDDRINEGIRRIASVL
ncbi:MAG: PLP-dependent aminotransferase family protein [Solirubrobacterales bacterium]|nr:PLP-dependent aminotransferase family protein [Solirubrobacterales bacterium]